ncbi:hypothetical protein B296_00018128 [Ensete ventricosum]|uniref:Uncharacterized protein n=1 Tax=Ensete ventricosum TaxID=4639 RepID=A0A427AI20_ENSVE|nr:hypothetical protein B296_00018128 [Ensete ventricosum]
MSWQVNPHLKRLQHSPISCNQCKHLCLPPVRIVPAKMLCSQQPSHPPRRNVLEILLLKPEHGLKRDLPRDARIPAGNLGSTNPCPTRKKIWTRAQKVHFTFQVNLTRSKVPSIYETGEFPARPWLSFVNAAQFSCNREFFVTVEFIVCTGAQPWRYSWELGTDLCAGHALQTTSSIGVQVQG